jgi:hypothetical protein
LTNIEIVDDFLWWFKKSGEYPSFFASASDCIKLIIRAFATGNAQEPFLKVEATYPTITALGSARH